MACSSVLVRLFLSGAVPLDYGNAPPEFSIFLGYFVLKISYRLYPFQKC